MRLAWFTSQSFTKPCTFLYNNYVSVSLVWFNPILAFHVCIYVCVWVCVVCAHMSLQLVYCMCGHHVCRILINNFYTIRAPKVGILPSLVSIITAFLDEKFTGTYMWWCIPFQPCSFLGISTYVAFSCLPLLSLWLPSIPAILPLVVCIQQLRWEWDDVISFSQDGCPLPPDLLSCWNLCYGS